MVRESLAISCRAIIFFLQSVPAESRPYIDHESFQLIQQWWKVVWWSKRLSLAAQT